MENAIDFKVFKKLSSKAFRENLDKISPDLNSKQFDSFLKTIIPHFENPELIIETGNSILQTIVKILGNKNNLDVFISSGSFTKLPFSNMKFHPSILNILYIIVIHSPQFLETISSAFPGLIKSNPRKSFIIIAIFCQNFNTMKNPWPIVDMLISQSSYFMSSEMIRDYMSLIAFLNKRFVEYRAGRAQHCWNTIYPILNSKESSILSCCYDCLCTIAEGYTGSIPSEIIIEHLKTSQIQNHVLAFLNISQYNEKDGSNMKLLSALLSIAETNIKATLVLMKFSCIVTNAIALASITSWFEKELPTTLDTLRLFLVIMRHREIRESISQSPNFIIFLKALLTIDKPDVASIACTIIRRVPLSKDFVWSLSSSGFLGGFYQIPAKPEDITDHAKLLLTDTICRITYVKEYVLVCEIIHHLLSTKSEFSDSASLVAVRLLKFSKCRAKMKELKMEELFKKLSNNKELSTVSKKFLRTWKENLITPNERN